MTNNFAKSAKRYSNLTRTENNAVALKTTDSYLLDLFATVGALRGKTFAEIDSAFQNAFAEDKLLAIKLMFYARNIRGGLGERDTFRAMLQSLAFSNPEIVIKNMDLIPFFGRYDDLYFLQETPAEEAMWEFIHETFYADINRMNARKNVSLLAKWLKSINTSSQSSREIGRKTARMLGLSERVYRKTLSELREVIRVTEKKMSGQEWFDINYEQVPAGAMKKYRKAFYSHDFDGFSRFIGQVTSGEKTIKAQTLFPYDIFQSAGFGFYDYDRVSFSAMDSVLEAQWKALPNYVEGENNILVMADTSGSMSGLPICISLSLAVYFAERNKGAFKDLFMTFSENPRFETLKGNTLQEKVSKVIAEVANTDLEKAYDLILHTAIVNKVAQEEMPKALIIISDMHFDNATRGSHWETHYQSMKRKYETAGYEMPIVYFWNVAQRAEAFQVSKNDRNVVLVSGASASTFRDILQNIGSTPYDFMVKTLSNPMYDCVKI